MKSIRSNLRSALLPGLVLSISLFITAPTAEAKHYTFPSLGFKIDLPGHWEQTKIEPGKKVAFKMGKSGKFSVTHKPAKLPLKAIAAKIAETAKKKNWKLLEERPNIRHRGNKAHLLVYQMPTKLPKVFVRSAFYLVNTDNNGYYTLYFGKRLKDFRAGAYKAVYATFDTLGGHGSTRRVLKDLGCKVRLPKTWKRDKSVPGKKTSFKMGGGGKFSISFKQKKLPLNAVAKAINATASKKGWKKLEERRNFKHRGNRAHLLVYQIPTANKSITVRSAFYLVNTPNGYYTLYFGQNSKAFRQGAYKAIYLTFDTL